MSTYQVTKPKGPRSTITLINNNTGSVTNLGISTLNILSILHEKEGIDIGPYHTIQHDDVWDFGVGEDTYKTLARTTMPMHKPTRVKKDKVEQPAPVAKTKTINLMDILLDDDEE